MKDAKGHGSDPRGAHSEGVQNLEDQHKANDLRLFADNDANLNRQSFNPVMTNLDKKAAKGVYDPQKAEKLWGYHADRAAQAYHKQFGSPGTKWHDAFPTSVRREAARQWERDHRP